MNENEQLERELKAFRPQEPSADFERRVEEALGESARLAVRQLPEPKDEPVAQPARRPVVIYSLYPASPCLEPPPLLSCFFPFPRPNPEPLRSPQRR